ncbi:MAG: TfoX/Sxy family DNA transformation protein [Maritimibacter sp.]|nr:TfoX/Sxy family DNA transformation protein [Maritimibacter sp.]
MPTPLTTIRNLGPASAKSYAKAGIDSAETLRALGPDAAYAKLLASGEPPHFIGYYAMVMGLMGRPWTDCRGAEKAALRARFDTIVATANPRTAADGTHDPDLERILDEIGLPPPASGV